MDEFAAQVLKAGMLSSLRQDESVGRQAVINGQTTAHLMDLSFTRDSNELSIPESYAVQGLSYATTPRESMILNLASQTPKPASGPGGVNLTT